MAVAVDIATNKLLQCNLWGTFFELFSSHLFAAHYYFNEFSFHMAAICYDIAMHYDYMITTIYIQL